MSRRAEWVLLAAWCTVVALVAVLTFSHSGEDSYISFRYSRHLAMGHGLVFNPGEWVEGYSNLLWVVAMVPFVWMGVPLHPAAQALSTLCLLGAVVVAWWIGRGDAEEGEAPWLGWWLPVAVGLEPLLHYNDDRGLETVAYVAAQWGALALLALRGRVWAAGLLGAAVVLLRPEGVGFAMALVPAAALVAGRSALPGARWDWRRGLRGAVLYALLPLAAFVGQLILRRCLYGMWLPNTVVAKSAGMGASIGEMVQFACSHGGWPWFAPLGLLWGLGRERWRALSLGALGLLAGAVVFRLIAGAMLNEGFRYFLPALLPLVLGWWLLLHAVLAWMAPPRKLAMVLGLAMLAPIPVLLFSDAPGSVLRGNTDAPRSRLHVRLAEAETWNIPARARDFVRPSIFLNAEAGRWIAENLPPDAVYGADQIGQLGWHAGTGQRLVDLLGLTDAHVARHGLTRDYLMQRGVQYLVIETCRPHPWWPEAWINRPHVPGLRAVYESEQLAAHWRPRWMLAPRLSFQPIGFLVHVAPEVDDGKPLETVFVGVSEAEFDRVWRVR
jgi:hypothetical protein